MTNKIFVKAYKKIEKRHKYDEREKEIITERKRKDKQNKRRKIKGWKREKRG
jgi:hypothetical protein